MKPLARYELDNFLSTRIIDAAKRVHQSIGPGFSEAYYRRAIASELRRQRLDVQNDFPVDVWQSNELAELYFLELFVEMKVIVSVRSSRQAFIKYEREQMIDQLEAASAQMGMIFNFGWYGLEYERIFPS